MNRIKILNALGLLAASAITVSASVAAEPLYSDVVRESLYVAVRDETKLAMNIYRPAVNGKAVDTPYPVVFAFTPYRARFRTPEGTIRETGLSERLGLRDLTNHGYVVAVADIRGKGASFGARRGFQDRTEALDGHDLVQWLAARPWSTGKVGMIGCSYLGGATVQVASTAPPALKAVFTGATDFDKYTFVRRGGITAQFNTRPDEPPSYDLQSMPVDADKDGSMLRAAVAEHADNTPMAALWYGMPYRDSVSEFTGTRFWEEVGPYTYLDTLRNSGIAFYFWGNWKDEPTEQVILAAANIGGKLIVGPGGHCTPPSQLDFAGEVRRFFDRYLKNVDNGIEREPLYRYWIDNGPEGKEWVQSDRLPGSGIPKTGFYLTGGKSGTARSVNDGTLKDSPPRSGSDSFTVNYNVGAGEYFAFWVDPMDDKGLSYTGPALATDTTLIGWPVVHLTVAADRTDANIFAYLDDVPPTGEATVVAFGRIAASHRKISPAPYDALQTPWHSGRAADVEPLTPGEPVQVSFALTPAAWVFKAGHRIRISITGADPRQRNLEQIRQGPPPRLTVSLGGAKPSRIELPLK